MHNGSRSGSPAVVQSDITTEVHEQSNSDLIGIADTWRLAIKNLICNQLSLEKNLFKAGLASAVLYLVKFLS